MELPADEEYSEFLHSTHTITNLTVSNVKLDSGEAARRVPLDRHEGARERGEDRELLRLALGGFRKGAEEVERTAQEAIRVGARV